MDPHAGCATVRLAGGSLRQCDFTTPMEPPRWWRPGMRTGQPTCQARCQRARQLRRQRALWRGKETATMKCQQNRSRRAESWVPRPLGTSGTCSLGT